MSYSGLRRCSSCCLPSASPIRNLHLILEGWLSSPHMSGRPSRSSSMSASAWPSSSAATSPTTACCVSLRLGSKWDLAFHQALKRDAKGEVIEFDIDPRSLKSSASRPPKLSVSSWIVACHSALVTSPETRSYVRMIIERLFATLPVLSHVELAKGIEIKILGSIP
ncbi:hypothetical protein ACOJBO_17795 [Rhizobium beringeri]